jgi:hypothetical protein
MLTPDLIERIRAIFLQGGLYVSISDAATLLGWSHEEMKEAIGAGEIELTTTGSGKALRRETVMAKALELWWYEAIEGALGRQAPRVLPPDIRTRTLRTRLPRYQIAMLQYLAEREQTSVGDILSRLLDDVANDRSEELTSAIPGFGAALAWPEVGLRLGSPDAHGTSRWFRSRH